MHRLGHTRSANRADHLLHAPDTFVRTPIPSLTGGTAIVHISPERGARFTQYTAEFEAGGSLATSRGMQRFVYILEGSLEFVAGIVTGSQNDTATVTSLTPGASPKLESALRPGSFAYLPADAEARLTATTPSRVAVIEKPYIAHRSLTPPPAVFGHESDAAATPLMGDPWLEVRTLLPDSPAFDFAVNTMTYRPGAALPMVEVHVMEHGLLMLDGEGIYRLGDAWYPVAAGDFIWMAPYCPQWFGALGKQPARYLIYKDFHRDPGGTP